jgi:hypothetical protein
LSYPPHHTEAQFAEGKVGEPESDAYGPAFRSNRCDIKKTGMRCLRQI